jgi:hypothetical protein
MARDLLDHIIDFVLGVVELLFDVTGAAICSTFAFELLVSYEDSGGLFGEALGLIGLRAHL